MRFTRNIFFIFMLFLPFSLLSQGSFEDFFENKSLRFDFLFAGNFSEVKILPVQMKEQPFWSGSKTNLTDKLNYGSYKFSVYDSRTEKLIFSKGFSSLFQEWQATDEAKKMDRTFYHTLLFPYPKAKVKLILESRQWEGGFKTIYSTEIDPENYFILHEKPLEVKVTDILNNGNPETKVDVSILAEGYTEAEMSQFREDAARVTGYLFENEPFKLEKDKFNVRAVETASAESGTDIPGKNIYKNTRFNSTFYSFDIERYLTTSDVKNIQDAVEGVPTDFIILLVNSERYGGGGFYNLISVCTSGNKLTKEVFAHEFGHCFAGLGDEYYTSSVAYNDYYNLKTEPWEPNLTTLVDFQQKWKSLILPSTPVPTPRDAQYEKLTGVFEGGGYVEKGIYSPAMNCRMKSNDAKGFCEVCQAAIRNAIRLYSE